MNKFSKVNLNRLAVFAAVVEQGSFTAAAREIGMAKTMVSTHIRRLEAELGATLFVRTTRQVTLTETGAAFYTRSRDALQEIGAAVEAVGNAQGTVRGTLRVTAPIDYGAAVITPFLVRLQQKYPELQVDLLCADRRFDLVADHIDIAVRLGTLADSTHHAIRLGGYTKWLVASPDFLARNGTPGTLAEAAAQPFIALSVLSQPLTYEFSGPRGQVRRVRFNHRLATNTANACRAAALAGGGLAMLTDFSISGDVASGRLVRLMPEWAPAESDIHAVFPSARHMPLKVRAFIDEIRRDRLVREARRTPPLPLHTASFETSTGARQ
ncbi:MAG TPA: LysR family transcriptional regulator [Castellaniella sp.]|uniref:LysR family transcriptional regulator n=1 Tax=Castellaniella sp. TaxID=1955812 RepID=UPI002F1B1571